MLKHMTEIQEFIMLPPGSKCRDDRLYCVITTVVNQQNNTLVNF